MYIHVYQIIKNRGPGPLRHADNRKYFSGLSLTQEVEGKGKNLEMFLLRKSNSILISEFRYGQTWKI